MTINPAVQAAQLFASHYGALVTGGAKTLPASGSGDIFTVTGGRVMVTSLTGVVTTAIQTQTCQTSVGHKPSGGSSQAATLATTSDISTLAVGSTLTVIAASFPAALALIAPTAVVVGTKLGAEVSIGGLCLVPAGTIQVTTGATNTGAIEWSVSYVPYDHGAVITAV